MSTATQFTTRSRIGADPRRLGVSAGDILEIHVGIRSLGKVTGGVDTVVLGLLDAVGPAGTLAAYAGMDDNSWHLAEWPPEVQTAYREELPAFDRFRSAANRQNGIIAERLRTWPGAVRSAHPEVGIVAVGAKAQWVAEPHEDDFAFGNGTSFERIKNAAGKVLMLGAPLGTITMLHHAETISDAPGKRLITHEIPVLVDGKRVWKEYRDIDSSSRGAYPHERILSSGEDSFEAIAKAALAMGVGSQGSVAAAHCYLFPAKELVAVALAWIQERFG